MASFVKQLADFSYAAGDRERDLQQCLPDTSRIELWVVSDSVLSFCDWINFLSEYETPRLSSIAQYGRC